MKKLIPLLLIFTMLFTFSPVYAQTTDTSIDIVVSEEEMLSAEAAVTDQQINEIIDIPDESALIMEQQLVIDDLETEKQITKDNLPKVLKNLYKYVVKRSIYHKRILKVMDKIQNINDPLLKKMAIIEFAKRYEAEKERDRKIHNKIKVVVKFLKDNKDNFTSAEKMIIKKIFKPLIIKYQNHRKTIIYIHKTIKQVKMDSLAGDIKNLTALADQSKAEGDLKKANELYEKAIAKGAGNDIYKKAGSVSKELEGKGPKVFVQGTRPAFDVKPVIKDGRTLVPLRAIAEALKASVKWNQETNTVIIIKGDITVEMTINKKVIKINGKDKTVDVPATVINGRTLVPLRTVSETLEADVTWDADTEVITIEDNFGDESQNLSVADLTVTGLGSEQELIPSTNEIDLVNELLALDEKTVQDEIAQIDQIPLK